MKKDQHVKDCRAPIERERGDRYRRHLISRCPRAADDSWCEWHAVMMLERGHPDNHKDAPLGETVVLQCLLRGR